MIFKFTISGKEDQIVQFEKKLLDILNKIEGRDEITSHEIHFCVHEAIINIIQHTYKWDVEKLIEIRIDVTNEERQQIFEVWIRDFGDSIEKPIFPPAKIGQFQLRRRGIYMISKIMEEFYVKPHPEIGNVTYMKKIFLL